MRRGDVNRTLRRIGFAVACVGMLAGQAIAGQVNSVLETVRSQPVPADEAGAYTVVSQLSMLGSPNDAVKLRTWLWRRDLRVIEGEAIGPPVSVAEAVASPLADQGEYGKAALAYVARTVSVTWANDDGLDPPPGAARLDNGVYRSKSGQLQVASQITSHAAAPIDIRWLATFRGPVVQCETVTLEPGATMRVWCADVSGYSGDGAGGVERIRAAVRDTSRIHLFADIATGSPTRHVTAIDPPSHPPSWEIQLGADARATASLQAAVQVEKAEKVAWRSRTSVPARTSGILGTVGLLFCLAGWFHLRSANRRVVPRGLFVGYMMLVAATVFVTLIDSGTHAPMSGALGFLAQMAMGLPWTLLLLSPDTHLPDGSSLPTLLMAANAVILFVFSCNGARYVVASGRDA